MLTDQEVAAYHRNSMMRCMLFALIVSTALFLFIGSIFMYLDIKDYEAKRERIISGSR